MIPWLALALAGDPIVDAMQAELDRSMAELSLPDADGPYFVAYRLEDTDTAAVRAQLGGVVTRRVRPSRFGAVEVRVGSAAVDTSAPGPSLSTKNASPTISPVPPATPRL